MNCGEFEKRLQKLLDRRIDPDTNASLRAHAAACRECRLQLATYRALFDGLDLIEPVGPSADFTDRVLKRAARLSPPPRRFRLINMLVATAAVVAVAIVSTRIFTVGRPEQQTTNVVSKSSPRNASPTPPPNSPRRSDVQDQTKPWPQDRRNMAAAEPASDYDRLLDQLESMTATFPSLRPPADRVWVDEMVNGFRPLTVSMSGVFRALRQTLPGTPPSVDTEAPSPPQADMRWSNRATTMI